MYSKIFSVLIPIVVSVTISGCSSDTAKLKAIKPDATNSISDPDFSENSGIDRSLGLDDSKDEMIDKSFRELNRYISIANACAHYQISYGYLPNKLEDLLNGFMLVWPCDVFSSSKKPIRIINLKPNPEDPSHVGKVYYERLDDLHGNIYFLSFDIDSVESGNLRYNLKSVEIELPIKGYTRDGNLRDLLVDMQAEDRFWLGYKMNVYKAFGRGLCESLERDGVPSATFYELLTEGNCYLLKEGMEKLMDGITTGKVEFDIGEVGDGVTFYHDMEEYDLITEVPKHIKWCIRITPYEEPLPYRKYLVESWKSCQSLSENVVSIFNQKDFKTYDFPIDELISKENIM